MAYRAEKENIEYQPAKAPFYFLPLLGGGGRGSWVSLMRPHLNPPLRGEDILQSAILGAINRTLMVVFY